MPRKGENIYKRKDGRWEGRYIKNYDLNHKAHYGYVYAKTYSDVKHKLIEFKSKNLSEPQKSLSSISTISSFCKKWLKETVLQVKQSTFVKYTNIVNNHIIPDIGICKISDVDTMLIKQFIDKKLTIGKLDGSGGLSRKTVKDIVSVLKLIINYICSAGIKCNCNFSSICIKNTAKNIDVLNKAEQGKLTKYLLNNPNYTNLGILICLYTGLRIGEICAIKFEDISINDKIIHVKKTMQRLQNMEHNDKKTNVVITSPKSPCSIRDIPLPKFIIDEIQNSHLYLSKAYLLSGESEHFVEPRTLQNRFKVCTKDCGLKNVNFHILRSTFATRCIETGFEIKSLSEILGHSSVNVTLNRYVHSSIELKRNFMDKLQPVF